jgi:ATP-dependent Lhr-like helicase
MPPTIGCIRRFNGGSAIRVGTNCARFRPGRSSRCSKAKAFLPIMTSIADRKQAGFSALYISPLKALINDQFRRLEELCDSMEIPVVKWHGDAPQAEKKKALARPDGIALITPESIEAMFTRRPADARRLLGSADFIVIDEVHSFLQGPRGLHVASLLRRIDAMTAKPARRVGLSATIGDLR